jgi:hypothetical protein
LQLLQALRSDIDSQLLGKVADWIIGTLTALISQFEQRNVELLIKIEWQPDYTIAPGNYTLHRPPCTYHELHDLGVKLSQRQQETDTLFGPVVQGSPCPMDPGGARLRFNTEMRRYFKICDLTNKLIARVGGAMWREGRMQYGVEMMEKLDEDIGTGTSATKRPASDTLQELDVWKRAREG